MMFKSTLTLCTASAILEGFDNQSMRVAAPRLVAEFGISSAQGRIADHHAGRERTLCASLLLFGLCSLLTAIRAALNRHSSLDCSLDLGSSHFWFRKLR
jgi:MFS transporter, AAHS family, 3-hydroxyphenylpropionic acid transporter